MFNSSDDGRASGAVGYGDHLQPRAHLSDLLSQGGMVTNIDLRLLPAGTQLFVHTRNSRYRVLMLDGTGCHALVEGGQYCCEETEAEIVGATCNGSSLRVGWICLGLSLELSVHGKRIVTSRVRAINVEPFSC
jgi:hypothetical protein